MAAGILQLARMAAPAIGGGIAASNPDLMKQLMQTFGTSPLGQVLQSKDFDEDEAAEAIKGRQEKKQKYFGRVNQEKIKEALRRRGFEGSEDELEIISGKILGGFDDTEISNEEADEMASEFEGLDPEDVRDDRTLNAQGGMIDRPLYDRA